jgi:hypothetical protein
MTELEMRQVLTKIQELGMRGRNLPDEPASRAEAPLIFALGVIGALATVVLEGDTLVPDRVELDDAMLLQLAGGEPVVVQTRLGYRVELRRKPA